MLHPVSNCLHIGNTLSGWRMGANSCLWISVYIDGRSVSERLVRVFKVDNHDAPGYASVQWFSEPEYPFTTPIVVKVLDDGSTIRKQLGCIIPITQIDPSRVIVEPDGDNVG